MARKEGINNMKSSGTSHEDKEKSRTKGENQLGHQLRNLVERERRKMGRF